MKIKTIPTPRNLIRLNRHPLSAEYGNLAPKAMEEIVAGLRECGIVGDRRITVYRKRVLDGWHLLRACIRANIKPKFQKLMGDDADAARFVEIMNDHRRHEDVDTMMRRAKARRARVLAARQQGQSTWAIAEAEGVSQKTIRNDLAAATEYPTQMPSTVTGLDGKVRPAQQPKLIPELAKAGYSHRIVPLLEAMPRGQQLDVANLVRDGVQIRDAIQQVQNQREPGYEPDEIEAEKGAKKAKPKNGAVLFDWDKFYRDWGALLRQVDNFGNAYGCKEAATTEELRNQLTRWKEQFKDQYRAVTGQEPPKE
jgi:hypothetical protein